MPDSEAHHTDQVFKRADSRQASIVSSAFHDCTFDRCCLAEATLQECRFVGCLFRHCDLSLLQVPGCSFTDTRFEGSKVIGVDWTRADWPVVRLGAVIGFSECVISHSTFIGLKLPGIRIEDCVAVDVDFREADLSGAAFAGTDLSGSLFLATNLTGADLSRARNYRIDLTQNVVRKARFALPEAMSLLHSLDIVLDEG
jgi:fluoroquinolone resistance protein